MFFKWEVRASSNSYRIANVLYNKARRRRRIQSQVKQAETAVSMKRRENHCENVQSQFCTMDMILWHVCPNQQNIVQCTPHLVGRMGNNQTTLYKLQKSGLYLTKTVCHEIILTKSIHFIQRRERDRERKSKTKSCTTSTTIESLLLLDTHTRAHFF